jgi:hypothetical protein
MHKKFIFGVFEQYLFAYYGDSHMGICRHFAQEICIRGSPYAKMPEKAYFGPFIFA